MLRSSYDYLKIILSSSDNHLMLILKSSNNHLTVILKFSYVHLMPFQPEVMEHSSLMDPFISYDYEENEVLGIWSRL